MDIAVSSLPITIERIDRAIAIIADVMVRQNLPQILPTLKRLEAERDSLLLSGDPLEYAKRLKARIGA
jgi:hypothetical protein